MRLDDRFKILRFAERELLSGVSPHIHAWTTTVACGSFGLGSSEPVADAMQRWTDLQEDLETLGITRLASAHQVHGNDVSTHDGSWTGWLRQRGVDGHITANPGTALAVTIADCTPVFIAHPKAVGMLHAGWRGTAAHILKVGLEAMARLGAHADECEVRLGPSICGPCYEVGPEVITAITGKPATGKSHLDVRAVLAEQASRLNVRSQSVSEKCTRCDAEFYSHRGGDPGRQLGIIALTGTP